MARHNRPRREARQGTRTEQLQRTRIAQTAAVLILEHGLTDWRYAKRKAARQLLFPENSALPDNSEIETALFEHQTLFGGETHALQLRARRLQALAWMERLAAFSPKLYGALAEGWGGEHQDIRLELTADDPKTVELLLLDAAIRYSPDPAAASSKSANAGSVVLRANDGVSDVLLCIKTPTAWQQRGNPARPALDHAKLLALLADTGDELG